jgi:choline monooxygenase
MTSSPETLAAGLYRDPATYARERMAVFARSWLLLAHESQLAEKGRIVAATIADYPVLAVRGENGIRAFHNVCRHRAGPLAPDGESACENFLTCKYHGWRYALDGRLANARDVGKADGVDVRQYGLLPLRCETWNGFVFVNMDHDAPPLAAAVEPVDSRARNVAFERFRHTGAASHRLRCHWKTYVENYLEGYHIPLVHPELSEAVDVASYSVEVDDPAVFHHARPRDGSSVDGLWGFLWPNLAINVYADGVMMERIVPEGYASTRLDYLYVFDAGASRERFAAASKLSDATTAQDIWICEAVQRNLDAGVYESGRLSPRHEGGVAWFQNRIRAAHGN